MDQGFEHGIKFQKMGNLFMNDDCRECGVAGSRDAHQGGIRLFWLILLLSVPVLLLAGCGSDPVNRFEEGFRNMKWASSPRDHAGLQLIAREGSLEFHQREKDDLEFFGVSLKSIVYGFHRERLYTVLLYFDTAQELEQLKEALTGQWGPPTQVDEASHRFFWNADPLLVLLTLDASAGEPSSVENAGRVSLVYKPVHAELELSGTTP